MSQNLKLKNELWARVVKAAATAGYSSAEEFVAHVIERELARLEDEPDPEVVERLKGMGYID